MNYKVAVITTLYKNDSPVFFKKAMQSILNQTIGFEKINIYIYIDGPIPDILNAELEKFENKIYKIFRADLNRGLPYGLNFLIERLEDEKYVFRMDMDDVCYPERFEEQSKYMDENSEIVLSGCNSIEIDENDIFFNGREYPEFHSDIVKSLPKCCPILHPSFCIRRSAFNDSNFRYELVHLAEDLAFVFNTARLGFKMGNLQKKLMMWRVSSDFIARRDRRRMIPEFKVYCRGIYSLKGIFSLTYFYPVSRLIFRLLPNNFVKAIYESNFRRRFLK